MILKSAVAIVTLVAVIAIVDYAMTSAYPGVDPHAPSAPNK